MNPSASSSVRWKVHDIKSFIETEANKNHVIPFLAFTETWLKSYMLDAQLHIPHYVVSRSDRGVRVGGGVLLYSHESIPLTDSFTHDDGTCEAVFCRFDTLKMCVIVVYRPPSAPKASFSNIINFMKTKINDVNDDSYEICILGDFNFPHINWETSIIESGGSTEAHQSADELLSFMSDKLLNQFVFTPTRNNNILDLFITNNQFLVTNVAAQPSDLSDHSMLDIMISTNPTTGININKAPSFDEKDFRSLDFHRANFSDINSKLEEIDWQSLRSSCSFEEFPELFTSTLLQICQSLVPRKRAGTGKPKVLNGLRRKKNRLSARLNALKECNGNPDHIQNVQNQLALIFYEIKEAINLSLDLREKNAVQKIKCNPKTFYSYAKSFSSIKSTISMLFNQQDDIVTDPKDMADALQDQFSSVYSDPDCPDIVPPDFSSDISKAMTPEDFEISSDDILAAISDLKSDSAAGPDGIPVILLKNCSESLCSPIKLLWKESFESGTVPKFYKESYVTPLYKKGDRARAGNYRPVSLTSHIIKIYERVLRKTIVQYLDDNNILCHNQHGFRSGRSCLTQMLDHFDDIMQGLTNDKDTDAIYLDYAKAFDKVDHRMLIEKLRLYGFSPQLVKWIESFLVDRSQKVVVDGKHSYLAKIISGVPQGTVLGPILFILFINDLESCVKNSKVRFFADDTRVCKQISSEVDTGELQADLDNIILWSKQNNMKLHEDKFELIIHKANPSFALYELPFTIEQMTYEISSGKHLYPIQTLKDLGVIVSDNLSWTPHINTIASRARSVAAWVLGVFKTRDRTTMLTLYKSLVRSHLEYCCPLWHPSKITDIQQLEGVQRTFTAKISGVQHLNYWERLKALKVMSLQRRRERYIILQMWKILHNLTPNDLNITFAAPSRLGLQAIVPSINKTSKQRHQSIYDNSFAILGPRLWNALPSSLSNSSFSQQQFKNRLTDYFNSIPDKPPIKGYCCQNNNSILNWNKAEAYTDNMQGWSPDAMA
jgi:hypothetical protein